MSVLQAAHASYRNISATRTRYCSPSPSTVYAPSVPHTVYPLAVPSTLRQYRRTESSTAHCTPRSLTHTHTLPRPTLSPTRPHTHGTKTTSPHLLLPLGGDFTSPRMQFRLRTKDLSAAQCWMRPEQRKARISEVRWFRLRSKCASEALLPLTC
eukprot:2422974-Rhodomonas_salina.1